MCVMLFTVLPFLFSDQYFTMYCLDLDPGDDRRYQQGTCVESQCLLHILFIMFLWIFLGNNVMKLFLKQIISNKTKYTGWFIQVWYQLFNNISSYGKHISFISISDWWLCVFRMSGNCWHRNGSSQDNLSRRRQCISL